MAKISNNLKEYLETSPFSALSEKETLLDFTKRIEKFQSLDGKIKKIMISPITSNQIRLTALKFDLSLHEAKLVAKTVRDVFFNFLEKESFADAIWQNTNICHEISEKIAADLDNKIFSLLEERAKPKNILVLKKKQEEEKNLPKIKGNVIDLRSIDI